MTVRPSSSWKGLVASGPAPERVIGLGSGTGSGSACGFAFSATSSPDPSLQNYQNPVFSYLHSGDPDTAGCSLTGGTFYDPTTTGFPSPYQNDYFYADFCSGWIRSFDPTTRTDAPFASGIVKPVDLQVSENGSLYYLFRGSSSVPASVREVRYTGS